MYKKKDKFKTIGQEMKLKNIIINDLDDIHDYETSKITKSKSAKKPLEKGELSLKSGLNLVKCRIVEIKTNYTYRCQGTGDRGQGIGGRAFLQKTNIFDCFLSGRLKYLDHETRNPICVGDFVNVDFTDPDNLRIEEVLARKNSLSRYINEQEIMLAANIDSIVIMTSVREPEFNSGLIDRYICVAEISHIPVIICVNKIDLTDDLTSLKDECHYYQNAGYQTIFISTKTGEGIAELKKLLKNKESLFTGHSGTGKSSTINSLQPGLDLKIGTTSDSHNKGKHTTTYSRMIAWNFGGFLIDTPGIKTLGLKKDDLNKLPYCFPGFATLKDHCSFANCTHTHEENCAVKKNVPKIRYNSYLRIRESLC
jgi:ribosome biogenesis GTPase